MRRKIITVIVSLILCMTSVLPAAAMDGGDYIYDDNNMIGSASLTDLNKKAAKMYERYGMATGYLYIADPGSAGIDGYGETFYSKHFAGKEGILLVETDEEWYIHKSAGAESIFSSNDEDALWEAFISGEYYDDCVSAYLDKAAEMMAAKGLGPAEAPATEAQQPAEEHPPRLVDEADLLTDDEEGTLVDKLDTVSEKWQCDVAVVTVDSLGGKTATEFADDYFDYNGYGYGDNADGVMLVISMESRDWAISTHAFGIEAFTDAGQEYIMDKVTPPLGDGSYAEAFNVFADQCDDFLEKARAGEPYDKGSLPKESHAKLYLLWIIPCLIAGAIVAFVMTINEKKSLKSVMKKAGAREYINGVKLSKKSDKFLYRNLDKVLIETDDDDGGSSTHVSSSGETHGGSSGKF